MKSGFVSLIGRPNVGKSTLINTILNTKIAITSSKPQTTRNIIKGIYNDIDSQIIFLDTPGIHKPKHKLGNELNRQAYYSIEDVDILLLLVDAKEGLGKGDEFIINKLENINKPVILVINKVDGMNNEQVMDIILKYKDLYNFSEIVPVSALTAKNIDTLIKVIKEYLPDNIKYYDDKTITTSPLEFVMSEIIREKIFRLTEEEVPHSTAVKIEMVETSKETYVIYATIVVERDALKRIIIGKQGSMVKQIGIEARRDLEKLLKKKVYLELKVKTIKKWRDKENTVRELGHFEEIW
jgi:GTP-binding protein Era